MTSQPLGTTSSQNGYLDIFLDRRLFHDDQRGLGQGITDNRPVIEKFRLIIETKSNEALKPSLKVQLESFNLFNPLFVSHSDIMSINSKQSLLPTELPCDIHLLNLRSSLSSLKSCSLFLQRFDSSCEAKCFTQLFKLVSHFNSDVIDSLDYNISQMKLLHFDKTKSTLTLDTDLSLKEMDISVFKLSLKS